MIRALIAVVLVALACSSSSPAAGKDCANGPTVFPGKGHPQGGHFERCDTPPAPPPPPPVTPSEPPATPPVSSSSVVELEPGVEAVAIGEAIVVKVHGKKAVVVEPPLIVAQVKGVTVSRLPSRTPAAHSAAGPLVPSRLVALIYALAGALGISLAVGLSSGPPPTFRAGR